MIDPIRNAAARFAQGAGGAGGVQPQKQLLQGGADPGMEVEGGGKSFGDTLKDALEDVSETQDVANDAIQAFLKGEPIELHEVMAATEEAGIALEMLIEIRNKVTDAYRTLINMQT